MSTVARLASLPGVNTASGMAALTAGDSATGTVLPVLPELAGVLPLRGLRRGSTVSVIGSSSLLIAVLAEATRQGAWAAAVGMPDLGVVAAAELGVEVRRFALVPSPGAEIVSVTAALLDGVDLVAIGGGIADRAARQLSARARHRGAVLLSLGQWPGADVELRCARGPWQGLTGDGHGHLREGQVVVHVRGRGAAARPVTAHLLLPGASGRLGHVRGLPAVTGKVPVVSEQGTAQKPPVCLPAVEQVG